MNSVTETARGMSNREMASVLFNIATLLRQTGHPNRFRIAAYERGARALMGLADQAREVLENEPRVPFRVRQHIGKRLQAKIQEMAVTGALAQYAENVAEMAAPEIAGLLTLPGMGPKTAARVQQTLGVTTAEAAVRAARDGRLRCVPGFGPRRTGIIAALPLMGEAEPVQGSLFDAA